MIYFDAEQQIHEKEEIEELSGKLSSQEERKLMRSVLENDKETIEKLSKATKWSDFAKEAPVVVILCADETLDPRWVEDLSIAAGYIYLEAVNQGLGTCWIAVRDPQGSRGEENYVREIIGAPEKIRILCLMPLGYPAYQLEEHKDSEFDIKKIHREKW